MIRKTILNNGVRVVSEYLPGVHSASIGFWVQSGSRHEPLELNGISHFVEHMLFKGTLRRCAKEIARTIDSVGGVLNGFTSREFCCFYAKVMAEHLPLAIDLLADMVQNPSFDLDEIEKERRVVLQEIHLAEETPEDYIHDLFCQAFWKDNPLGRPIAGSLATVNLLSRADILKHVEEHYCGGNLIVAVAGGIDHDAVISAVSARLSALPCGERPQPFPSPVAGRGIEYQSFACDQTHLCLGTAALPQNHGERFSGYLLNAILGGNMSSRLFQAVREERGLAYAIYSYLSSHADVGCLAIYSAASPEEFPQVVGLLLKECRKLREEPVSSQELTTAKQQLQGSFMLSLESTDNRMTRLAKNEIYLGHHLSIEEVMCAFDRVSAEGLQQVAGSMFRDEHLTLQVLGRTGPEAFPLIDLTLA